MTQVEVYIRYIAESRLAIALVELCKAEVQLNVAMNLDMDE